MAHPSYKRSFISHVYAIEMARLPARPWHQALIIKHFTAVYSGIAELSSGVSVTGAATSLRAGHAVSTQACALLADKYESRPGLYLSWAVHQSHMSSLMAMRVRSIILMQGCPAAIIQSQARL